MVLAKLAGVIPPLIVLGYAEAFARGQHRPWPWPRLLAIALGALITWPAGWLGGWLLTTPLAQVVRDPTLSGIIIDSLGVTAPLEELLKAVCFLPLLSLAGKDRVSGLLLGLYAAMGFAAVENVHYMLDDLGSEAFGFRYTIRAYLTVPMHAASTGLLAALAVRRRVDGRGPGIWLGFPLAVLIHGAFNVSVSVPGLPMGLVAPSLLSVCLIGFWLIPVAAIVSLRVAAGRLDRDDRGDET